MPAKAQKKPLARLFQERLTQLFQDARLSVSAGARRTGIDRSTLSQLLSSEYSRLPRAETVATLARTFSVSSDWLLGLSEDRQKSAELIDAAMGFDNERVAPVSDTISRWYKQVPDSKIRYVSPVGIPGQLKTAETLIYEYAPIIGEKAARKLVDDPDRIEMERRRERDFEACTSQQKLLDFADGAWIWRGFPAEHRRAQLLYMADEVERLYPNYRLHIFDEAMLLTVCFYVFGNKGAVLQTDMGRLSFTRDTHISYFTKLFDSYIRYTVVHPHEAAGWLRRLAQKVA